MLYRVIMANYTISVSAEVFETLKGSIEEPSGHLGLIALGDGKWIAPAHVLAIEAIAVADAPPPVLTHVAATP